MTDKTLIGAPILSHDGERVLGYWAKEVGIGYGSVDFLPLGKNASEIGTRYCRVILQYRAAMFQVWRVQRGTTEADLSGQQWFSVNLPGNDAKLADAIELVVSDPRALAVVEGAAYGDKDQYRSFCAYLRENARETMGGRG